MRASWTRLSRRPIRLYRHQERENRREDDVDCRSRTPAAPANLARVHPLYKDLARRRGADPDRNGAVPALTGPVQGQISTREKKNAISCAAFSGESEPCTELASIDSAKSLRIVPESALAGSVAPITSRFLATAFSPSSTCTTTGPEIMKLTKLL